MKSLPTTMLATFVLVGIVCLAARAQESTNALAPEAQDAIDKGIIAAKSQDYLLAIRYFEDARKVAPSSPEVFYNLGLAESQIPGRELRAICWFGAFLTANPDSPKAAAIKEQIKVLDVKNQSNISKLIRSAYDVANKLEGNQRIWALTWVAELYAGSGDSSQAMAVAKEFKKLNITNLRFDQKADVVEAQLDAGDFEDAADTVASTDSNDWKHNTGWLVIRSDGIAYTTTESLALAQAEAGDFSDAEKTAHILDRSLVKDFIERAKNNGTVTSPFKTSILPSAERAREWLKPRFTSSVSVKDSAGNYQELNPLPHDWLGWLDSDKNDLSSGLMIQDLEVAGYSNNKFNIALKQPIFVNLADYLKSQQTVAFFGDSRPLNPVELFTLLHNAAAEIIATQIFVDQMLKQMKDPPATQRIVDQMVKSMNDPQVKTSFKPPNVRVWYYNLTNNIGRIDLHKMGPFSSRIEAEEAARRDHDEGLSVGPCFSEGGNSTSDSEAKESP